MTQDTHAPRKAFWLCDWPTSQMALLLELTEWCHGAQNGLSLDYIWLSEDDLGRTDFQSVDSLRIELQSEVLARLAAEGQLRRIGEKP